MKGEGGSWGEGGRVHILLCVWRGHHSEPASIPGFQVLFSEAVRWLALRLMEIGEGKATLIHMLWPLPPGFNEASEP